MIEVFFLNQELDDEACIPTTVQISPEQHHAALLLLVKILTRNYDALGRILVRDNKVCIVSIPKNSFRYNISSLSGLWSLVSGLWSLVSLVSLSGLSRV